MKARSKIIRKVIAGCGITLVVLACQVLSAGTAEAQKGRRSSVVFVNSSSWDIYALFLSPSASDYWGPDQLGDAILRSGQRYTLTDIRCGIYDIKLVDEEEDECVLTELDICGSERLLITDEDLLACQGYDTGSSLTFYNESDWEIHYLYLSPSASTRWGQDQLGQDVLAPGEYLELSNIDCGTYDIKMVDEDGDECVVTEIDICAEETGWRITNQVLLSCQGYR
jgi:hypothetical protein